MIFARSFARASGPNNPSASRSGTAGAAAVAAAGGSAAGALLAWTSERVSMSTSTAAASAAAASVASAARTKLAPLAGSRGPHLQQQQRIWTATTTSASDGFKTAAPAPLFPSSLLKPSNTAPSWSPAYRLFSGGSSGTSPTAATASPTASPSFVAWYESKLQAHPIPTKMVTGGILWSVGDAVAQILPPLTHGESPPEYDWGRTGRAGFFGFAIHAPTSHVHFNFLEWMTVRSGLTGLQIPIFKTICEQFIYWSWISNSMYHAAMGAMQGMNLQQIYARIEDVLWDTQKAQWVFWIPVQLLNFRYIPVRHQLNVVLVTSVVWTALLSAWYPPTKPDLDNDEEKEVVASGAAAADAGAATSTK